MTWPSGPGQPPGGGGGYGPLPEPLRLPEPVPEPPPKQLGRVWIIAAAGTGLAVLAIVVAVVFFRKSDPERGVSVGASASLASALRSSARDHVPRGCELLVRLDVGKLLESPIVKKRCGPVLDEITTGADAAGRRTRDFLHEAGIDPRQDLKELTVCVAGLGGPVQQQRLAILLTGTFRPGAVATALEASAAASGDKVDIATFDGRKLIKTRSKGGQGLLIGQAADGAIVLSNDTPFFETAAPLSQNESVYQLPVSDGALVVDPTFLKGATLADNPIGRHAKDITRVVGTATLDRARGELRIGTTGPAEASALAATLTSLLDAARKEAAQDAALPGGPFAGAKVSAQGNDVTIELPWSDVLLDRAAQKISTWLHDAHQKGNLSL